VAKVKWGKYRKDNSARWTRRSAYLIQKGKTPGKSKGGNWERKGPTGPQAGKRQKAVSEGAKNGPAGSQKKTLRLVDWGNRKEALFKMGSP